MADYDNAMQKASSLDIANTLSFDESGQGRIAAAMTPETLSQTSCAKLSRRKASMSR
jgi:hypothetical protein